MERPKIADKVRFWEEQDRINKELIPRVLKQHELLAAHVEHHPHADPEARAQVRTMEERIAAQIRTLEENTASRTGTLEESVAAQMRTLEENTASRTGTLEESAAAAVHSAKRQSLIVSFVSLAVAIAAVVLSLA